MRGVNDNNTAASTPLGDDSLPLLYNITAQVTWQVHEAWLMWMLDEYIPAILGTGCFTKHQVVRLLETDETDGPVYAVQYYAENKACYDAYISLYQPGFKKLEYETWGDRIFSFASLMQVVN